MSSDCPDDALLEAYRLGELSGSAHERINKHVGACSHCSARIEEREHADRDSRFAKILREATQHRPPNVPGYTYATADGSGVPHLLGKGGLGSVYLARDGKDQEVAIKFIQVGPDTNVRLRLRFVREVEAALALHHEGIVRAFDFGTSGGRLYYVMQYVPGTDLNAFLGGRPLANAVGVRPGEDIARLALRLAQAIEYAHANGIIHRDLKPSNVLVATDGNGLLTQVKIADFGMARRLQAASDLTQEPVGTPVYMAPEQADGRLSLSPTVDVYGLGAILYVLLTGQPPFDPKWSLERVREALRDEEPLAPRRRIKETPYDLETIVLKCLRKEPSDRYESAEALADDLKRFLAGERPRAKRLTWVDRALTWARRNPRAVVVGAAISTLLIVSALFAVLWRGQKQQAEGNAARANDLAAGRRIDAARFALARGQLAVALPLFDAAVEEADAVDRTALEVERLRCLLSYRQWGRLAEELDRLGSRDDLPPRLAAEVRLHRGDVLLWEAAAEKQEQGRRLLHEALAVAEGLRPADAAFARGLLAEGARDARNCFEEALRHDRFHLRANSAYLMELVLTGDMGNARTQAAFARALFPEEPVPALASALVATLAGDHEAKERHIADLRRLLDDSRRSDGFEKIFAHLEASTAAAFKSAKPPSELQRLFQPPQDIFLSVMVLNLLRGRAEALDAKNVPPVIGIGLPTLTRPTRLLGSLIEAHNLLSKNEPLKAADLLERLGQAHPESLISLMHATALLMHSYALEQKGDMAGCLRVSRRAHALALQAADGPTLMPASAPFRHNARWMCVLIEVGWESQYRSDAARAGAAVLALGVSPLSGTATAAALGERLSSYPRRVDRRHLQRVLADSGADDEARAALVPRLLPYFDLEDARLILADWVDDAPKEATPYRLRARLELGTGNAAEAHRWAERGLGVAPNDGELRALHKRSEPANK